MAIILDVLHYISYEAQEDVLRRIRAALPAGGTFITRIGDAAGGLPFHYSNWVDRTVFFLRGHRLDRIYCRTLERMAGSAAAQRFRRRTAAHAPRHAVLQRHAGSESGLTPGHPRMRHSLAATVTPREAWAWAMYDFANSGYTTVVITAIFNAYFVSVVAGNQPWATFAWTAALAVSYAAIMFTAPLIGAYADAWAAKKKLLALTTIGCIVFTALLAFSGPGSLWLTIPLLVLSNYFYGSGENLIAAFLPELARGDALGKVSGWGWSLGYVGGLVSLGACLAYVTWAQAQGQHAADFVPMTMLITAALFALSSLPTFLFLKERAVPQPHLQGKNLLQESFARLKQTLAHARDFRDLRRFLICTVFYQAGIQAVITLAAIYAQQAMHFTTQQTIMLIFVVNITAAVGAFLFGFLQDRIGHIPAIALTLLGWIVMILLAWAAKGRTCSGSPPTSPASAWAPASPPGARWWDC